MFNKWSQYCNSGTVNFDIASSSNLLLIQTQINENLNNSFTPSNAAIMTFDFMNGGTFWASYQIILSTDLNSSYLIVNYKMCNYDTTGWSFYSSPGVYFIENGQQKSIPISDPCRSSNVGLAGVWIFQIEKRTYTTTTVDPTTVSTTISTTVSTTTTTSI